MVDPLKFDDVLSKSAQQLEMFADLKSKGIIDEKEFQKLKQKIMSHLNKSLDPENDDQTVTPKEWVTGEPSYGFLHEQLLKKLGRSNVTPIENDVKSRLTGYLSEMAENQVLNSGDSSDIKEVIDILVDVNLSESSNLTPGVSNENKATILKTVASLAKVYYRIRGRKNSSTPAKAIVEVTYQSATEGADKVLDAPAKTSLWKTLVLEDLEGALEGGAAAVGIAPAFSFVALPVAATFGIIVGAGIKSSKAYSSIQ
jgi:hypothetical protein